MFRHLVCILADLIKQICRNFIWILKSVPNVECFVENAHVFKLFPVMNVWIKLDVSRTNHRWQELCYRWSLCPGSIIFNPKICSDPFSKSICRPWRFIPCLSNIVVLQIHTLKFLSWNFQILIPFFWLPLFSWSFIWFLIWVLEFRWAFLGHTFWFKRFWLLGSEN